MKKLRADVLRVVHAPDGLNVGPHEAVVRVYCPMCDKSWEGEIREPPSVTATVTVSGPLDVVWSTNMRLHHP